MTISAEVLVSTISIILSLFASAFYSGKKLGENSEKVTAVNTKVEHQQLEIDELRRALTSVMESTGKIQIAVAVLTENMGKITVQLEVLSRKLDARNN